MDVISKKKSNISGSDIDEELEGCLEGLEDIANEIIASGTESDSELPVHKEIGEEKQECNKDDFRMKVEDKMSNQTVPYETVGNKDLVQSIKEYIQDLVKVKNTIGASPSENSEGDLSNSNIGKLYSNSAEKSLNNLKDSNIELCSDGELISDGSISNLSTRNNYEIIEGTEVISDNSEWDNLESGECSSSEEVLHKLCEDDVEYLSDATTVTGEDKSQIKKSVQEYYKKSEDCFLSFYSKIKHDLIDGIKNVDDNSSKSKSYSNCDNSIKKVCRITNHADYNKAKLTLREFKRRSSQYKKNLRQNDSGHISTAVGNEVLLEIVSHFDSHMNHELRMRVSDDLKNTLARLKRNVKRYERKVGLRKREPHRKNKMINESDNTDRRESKYNQGKIMESPDLQLNYKNTDGRKLKYSPDKIMRSPEKSAKNKYYESYHNQESHITRRDSATSSEKHNYKDKFKGNEKMADRSNLSEKRANINVTISSYLEDCEQSVSDKSFSKKGKKIETNIFKKQLENLENRSKDREKGEKKISSIDSNKLSAKQTDKKNMDPNYDNGELFITYSELIKNENKNCKNRMKEGKSTEAKDVSVFAMTLSSGYRKNSTHIPFLHDEVNACSTEIHSKELNQPQDVNYLNSRRDQKRNLLDGSRDTGYEKTKQSDVLISPKPVVGSHSLRSISISPIRTSRSRSNSLNRFLLEKEKYSRKSRSRSNSLSRNVTDRGRYSRRSRSRSSSVIIEREKYSRSSKTTPYAYRRRRSRSNSRIRYKRYRSPSPQYRKRYRSRSRSRRHKKNKKSRRKYISSSSDERDVSPIYRASLRSFERKTPTRSFGDELRRNFTEENEKAFASLKLTLAAQDKGPVSRTELVSFTSSSEEKRKDVTYKPPAEANEVIHEEVTTLKNNRNEYEDQVSSTNLSVCKLSELDFLHQTDSSNEKSEASLSSKMEPPPSQPSMVTPPLIPLPPLPPNEPQPAPAPPLPASTNDVKVVATYTSYVPMSCPSQPPPQNYMHPPPTNDMYMPYHHNAYMYPSHPGYQMGNDPSMYHQPPPPPPHMMGHPHNSYAPAPFSYMHNAYPVPMAPYQNTSYQPPVMAPNFTCHQNIVTVTSEPISKKAAPSGPVLMEIASDSDNSVHSPVLSQNPTIQEAIQFVKHKMLKDDIKKAISENKTGVDNIKNKETENMKEAIIEEETKKPVENKHEPNDKVKLESKINEDISKNNSRKIKPIKFSLQPKVRPITISASNKSDILGNSEHDCENIPVPSSSPKKSCKEQLNEQSALDNTVGTNNVTIKKGPIIYSNALPITPVKNDESKCNEKGSEPVTKTKCNQLESETKSNLKIIEIKENKVSNKTKDSQVQKKTHENISSKSILNDGKNKNKIESTQNSVKQEVDKKIGRGDKQISENCDVEESRAQQFKEDARRATANKTVSTKDAESQKNSVTNKTIKTIHKNDTGFSATEEEIKLKESEVLKTQDTEFLKNDETINMKVAKNKTKTSTANIGGKKQNSDMQDKNHNKEAERTEVDTQEKLKVKFTDEASNKYSESDIPLESSVKKNAEPSRQCVSVIPENKHHTEVPEKEENINNIKCTYQDSEINELNEEKGNINKENVVTVLCNLLNEEKKIFKKTMNEALHLHASGTVSDKSESVQPAIKVSSCEACEDRVESKSSSKPVLKDSCNKKEDSLCMPCEPHSANMLLQNHDLTTKKSSTTRSLRNRYKKQTSPNSCKSSNKLESSIKDNKTETSEIFRNEIAENFKQKTTSKIEEAVEKEGKVVTCSTSKTEYEMSAICIQQGEKKVHYRACPLSKKTPSELTQMFLHPNDGIHLKDLRINLVRCDLPSSNIGHDRPSTSQDNNFGNKMSIDRPSQNKRGRKKTKNHEAAEVEGNCDSVKPIIQHNKLTENVTSGHCENHKKVLEILNSFKRNKTTEENKRKRNIILKVVLSENTTEVVPLGNYPNFLTKVDKLNSIQGQNKEDFTKMKECVNEKNNTVVDHEENDVDCKSGYEKSENKILTIPDSLASDQCHTDISLNSKKQGNLNLEHKEDSSDSIITVKKTGMHLELCKEFNSETDDSLLEEFASNDSNASLTCEQVSANSLILKINRSKRSKKRKMKFNSQTDSNKTLATNMDDNNTETTLFNNEENASYSRSTYSSDTSTNIIHLDESLCNAAHLAELAVFDFKDESSCDTGLDNTYLSPKRRKLLDKKKDKKIKMKRNTATDDTKSDYANIQPKVLRSTRSKTNKIEVTDTEMSNFEADISKVTEGKQSSDELQPIVLVSNKNTEGINVLTDRIAGNRLWERINQCLNSKHRNVATQVRFKQFALHGEAIVEGTETVFTETETLSLSSVVNALIRLRDTCT